LVRRQSWDGGWDFSNQPTSSTQQPGVNCHFDNNKVVPEYKYTAYFENEVLRKRPYIKKEWCVEVIENPIHIEVQGDSRVRFWGEVSEFGNRIFRVVTLADRVTIHNAFPDSGFRL
jgi:hypothetical protein